MFEGFGFSNYRSIGDKEVLIAPLKKINFIIGQNNSGKSNILRFLKVHLPEIAKHLNTTQSNYGFLPVLDRHLSQDGESAIASVYVPMNMSDNSVETFVATLVRRDAVPNWYNFVGKIKSILQHMSFQDERCMWFEYRAATLGNRYEFYYDAPTVTRAVSTDDWMFIGRTLTNMISGPFEQFVTATVDKIKPSFKLPNVEFIPAIRKIGDPSSQPDDYSGVGIIERLARLQNPIITEQTSKKKFLAIRDFVRNVLENETATIEIPFDKGDILVHMDGKTLPLASLGTGIHEVIILAAAATTLDGTILCVEEPELHIHPLLQRKLINYLSKSTSNQYIFSTHSAHLLEATEAEVFHVTLVDGASHVDAVSTSKDKFHICHDLGYKASDLLQSNSVIWVEGPSDRIYLKHWIKAIDDTLVEGVHYSIMFYGGRLASHLTAKEAEEVSVEDFISVISLNRNSSIIIDSDMKSSKDTINATKQRLQSEFNGGKGFAWITYGKEIENYIDPNVMEECIKAVHPRAIKIVRKGQWDNPMRIKCEGSEDIISANKVKVARHLVEKYKPDLARFDLNEKVQEVVAFIKKSNGIGH